MKTPEIKDLLDEVGFVYYLVLARMHDITPVNKKTKKHKGLPYNTDYCLCESIHLFKKVF